MNADGSGVQTNTFDVSELLDNPMIKMGIAGELKEQGNGDVSGRIDSTFNLTDELLPLNPQWTAAEQELVGRVAGKMVMDLEEGEGVVTTTFAFQSPDEIGQLATILDNANQADDKKGNPLAGITNQDFLISTLALNGKKFSRTTVTANEFNNPLADAGLDESSMSMMKEMFGDAVMGYRIDFPGKIKKVKGFPGHEIVEDNVILMLFDFTEVMEDPELIAKALTGEVKFK